MLKATNFGIAGGIMCGLFLFFFTLLALFTGYGHELFEHMGNTMPGFGVSLLGSLFGFVYGFIKGFILFFGVAWIYNRLG